MPLLLFPNIIVLTFSSLLIPEFTEFSTKSEYLTIKRVSKKILNITIFFSVIVSMLIFIYASQLSLFMYKSQSAVIYIKILSPLIPIMYLDSVVDAMLKGLNKQVAVLVINIIDLITTISLIYILIPKFGISGYVSTIYFSELLNFFLSYFTFKKTVSHS